MTLSDGSRELVLAFADDEHVIGARHTNWIGLGPFLEEDLAFCSIAQDELGHAIALYELVLGVDDRAGTSHSQDRSIEVDHFALLRDPADFRSCRLAEIECSDWNDSLVRHWLYDRAEELRWANFAAGSDEQLRSIAARAQREESFHVDHAVRFMERVATTDATGRIRGSIERLIPIAWSVWAPVDGEREALADGVVATSSDELAEQWRAVIRTDLERFGLRDAWPADDTGRRHERTTRSEGFDDFLAGLQQVLRLDPTAVW